MLDDSDIVVTTGGATTGNHFARDGQLETFFLSDAAYAKL